MSFQQPPSNRAAAPQDPPASALDIALRGHFHDEAEPADGGFSARVLAALPARAPRPGSPWHARAQIARWAAISVAACAAGLLWPAAGVAAGGAQSLAAYTLLGLMAFWSLPLQWNAG